MFLHTLVSSAYISFIHLFLHSLNEVYRSSIITHALFHPIFIHRILLFPGSDGFPASEPVHITGPIGSTFLRQRTANMRAGSTRPRVEPSGAIPLPPSSTGAAQAKASSAIAGDADIPPPTTLDDSDIRRMLDHVLTIQVAQE